MRVAELSHRTGYAKITLQKWAREEKIPSERSPGGQFRFSESLVSQLSGIKNIQDRIAIGYCRVSSQKQSDDLQRQVELVQQYLVANGYRFEIITDIGSGINYRKEGLRKLLLYIASNKVDRIIVLYKDRLLRFGNELIEEFCSLFDCKLEVIDNTERTEQEELVEDLIQIIMVFSCRLNGKRSHKSKKLLQELKDAVSSENQNQDD